MDKQWKLDDYIYNRSDKQETGDYGSNTSTFVQMDTCLSDQNPPIDRGWCYIVTAAIGWFCCAACGIPATICALFAYVDIRNQDYRQAKRRIRAAYGCGITAIVIGSIILLVFVIVIARSNLVAMYVNMLQQSNTNDANNAYYLELLKEQMSNNANE